MWRRRHILIHTQRLCSGLTAAAGQGLTSGESSGADILFETLTIDLEVSLFVNVRANRMRADGLADGCSTPSTLISPTLHLPSSAQRLLGQSLQPWPFIHAERKGVPLRHGQQ